MRNISLRFSLIAPAACAAALGLAITDGTAQSYPSKNVTIVVPYSAGSNTYWLVYSGTNRKLRKRATMLLSP